MMAAENFQHNNPRPLLTQKCGCISGNNYALLWEYFKVTLRLVLHEHGGGTVVWCNTKMLIRLGSNQYVGAGGGGGIPPIG